MWKAMLALCLTDYWAMTKYEGMKSYSKYITGYIPKITTQSETT